MSHQRGFTFIELIVIIGVFAVLASITTVTLLGVQRKPVLTSSVDTLIADIRQQQGRAMNGAGGFSYGVYIGQSQYVLFSGITFDPGNQSNSVISLDPNIVLSTRFGNSKIVFASGSGEVVNFSPTNNTIGVLQTLNNEGKTIELNRYGVITNVY